MIGGFVLLASTACGGGASCELEGVSGRQWCNENFDTQESCDELGFSVRFNDRSCVDLGYDVDCGDGLYAYSSSVCSVINP